MLGSGIYNLGFIAVNRAAIPLLQWWRDRLVFDATSEPSEVFFTDQRWMDFAPALARVRIVRHPGYNVAYWNLHSRFLERREVGYRVNGQELVFMHFSGYNPEKPHILSSNQGDFPRVLFSERQDVFELFNDYREEIIKYSGGPSAPYGFSCLNSGMPLDKLTRSIVRQFFKSSDRAFEVLPFHAVSAFSAEGETLLLEWLTSPPTEISGKFSFSRYAYSMYQARPDVRSAFPDIESVDREHFRSWLHLQGFREFDTPEILHVLPPDLDASDSIETAAALTDGPSRYQVRVVGYLRAALGIAEAARRIAQTVEEAGLSLCTLPYTATRSEMLYEEGYPVDPSSSVDVNIICINADMLKGFARLHPDIFASAKRNVGVWFWELESFPDDLVSNASYLDEIWAGSEFIADALRAKVEIPIRVARIPLVGPGSESPRTEQRADLSNRFQFLFAFDYASIFERKNPLGVVEAYCRAFGEGDGVELVVKSINGRHDLLNRERLRLAVRTRSDITLIEEYLGHDEQEELCANCDCYVSLHRSEGLGLTMAHAMALGKAVIATSYGGNLDFMGDGTAFLVPYEIVPVGPGSAPYLPEAFWAEPDLEVASELMRAVVGDRDASARVGRRAKESIEGMFDHQRCAEELGTWYQTTFQEEGNAETPELEVRSASGKAFHRISSEVLRRRR
ncbi:MAG: glycosyltransferase family 4 protein [Acidimicrobiaceae bacterium]|nr:glycosyltransferase family 4 protein [Acidimicrobiaceae bacterium]